MTLLRFDIERVKALAEHARKAPENLMTFEGRARIYGEDKMLESRPGEQGVAEPSISLVKDSGIYLMSSGIYPEGHASARPGGARTIEYARDFDPTAHDGTMVWRDAVTAVGGDDFCIEVPIDWIDQTVEAAAPLFVLSFSPDEIGLVLMTVVTGGRSADN